MAISKAGHRIHPLCNEKEAESRLKRRACSTDSSVLGHQRECHWALEVLTRDSPPYRSSPVDQLEKTSAEDAPIVPPGTSKTAHGLIAASISIDEDSSACPNHQAAMPESVSPFISSYSHSVVDQGASSSRQKMTGEGVSGGHDIALADQSQRLAWLGKSQTDG